MAKKTTKQKKTKATKVEKNVEKKADEQVAEQTGQQTKEEKKLQDFLDKNNLVIQVNAKISHPNPTTEQVVLYICKQLGANVQPDIRVVTNESKEK